MGVYASNSSFNFPDFMFMEILFSCAIQTNTRKLLIHRKDRK